MTVCADAPKSLGHSSGSHSRLSWILVVSMILSEARAPHVLGERRAALCQTANSLRPRAAALLRCYALRQRRPPANPKEALRSLQA